MVLIILMISQPVFFFSSLAFDPRHRWPFLRSTSHPFWFFPDTCKSSFKQVEGLVSYSESLHLLKALQTFTSISNFKHSLKPLLSWIIFWYYHPILELDYDTSHKPFHSSHNKGFLNLFYKCVVMYSLHFKLTKIKNKIISLIPIHSSMQIFN